MVDGTPCVHGVPLCPPRRGWLFVYTQKISAVRLNSCQMAYNNTKWRGGVLKLDEAKMGYKERIKLEVEERRAHEQRRAEREAAKARAKADPEAETLVAALTQTKDEGNGKGGDGSGAAAELAAPGPALKRGRWILGPGGGCCVSVRSASCIVQCASCILYLGAHTGHRDR